MRIAFDYQTFLLQEYGGISRYFCSLAQNLQKAADVKIIAPLHINSYLSNLPPQLVSGRRICQIPKTGRLLRAANNLLYTPSVNRFRPDVIHETYYSSNTYAQSSALRVVTVYDMIHERFSYLFQAKDYCTKAKRIAVNRADHVICISEHTRNDLLELFNVAENKISVIHLGYDSMAEKSNTDHNAPKLVGGRPYILYVGFRGGHKNFKGMMKAFASSSMLRNNFYVVCFGGGVFKNNEIRQFQELGLNLDKIVQIGGGDEKLASYYRGATAFIYPSLYEGFGIPPLEAMSSNCPVICSNTSSVPEVVNDAGEYFDPNNVDSIRYAMELVLDSSERRSDLIAKGRVRCGIFSWSRTASETLVAYKQLL
jgi:glycosyltransferase involved in cell wall biosynthesis